MIEVIPAIIAHSREELEKKIRAVEPFVEKVQIDIMDGKFVQDTTVGLEEVESISTQLIIQAHLMVVSPEEIISLWVSSPAVKEIIIHIESAGYNFERLIQQISGRGRKIGVALNPETDNSKIYPVLGKVDFVQFMAVHPGKHGGDFVESVLRKISAFHSQYHSVKIIVDGAMHPETARMAVAAGASAVVIGGHIFTEGRNISEAIKEFKHI